MSANIFPSYVRFECDKCGASETFDAPLVTALALAFKAGWRAAGTEPDDKTRHYCAGCYTPMLYDELEGRATLAEDEGEYLNERIDRLTESVRIRDEKIIELERERDEAQDHKRS